MSEIIKGEDHSRTWLCFLVMGFSFPAFLPRLAGSLYLSRKNRAEWIPPLNAFKIGIRRMSSGVNFQPGRLGLPLSALTAVCVSQASLWASDWARFQPQFLKIHTSYFSFSAYNSVRDGGLIFDCHTVHLLSRMAGNYQSGDSSLLQELRGHQCEGFFFFLMHPEFFQDFLQFFGAQNIPMWVCQTCLSLWIFFPFLSFRDPRLPFRQFHPPAGTAGEECFSVFHHHSQWVIALIWARTCRKKLWKAKR